MNSNNQPKRERPGAGFTAEKTDPGGERERERAKEKGETERKDGVLFANCRPVTPKGLALTLKVKKRNFFWGAWCLHPEAAFVGPRFLAAACAAAPAARSHAVRQQHRQEEE